MSTIQILGVGKREAHKNWSMRKPEKAAPVAGGLSAFLVFSVLVANAKKLLHTVANPARGLLNREKRTKRESLAAPPAPPSMK